MRVLLPTKRQSSQIWQKTKNLLGRLNQAAKLANMAED